MPTDVLEMKAARRNQKPSPLGMIVNGLGDSIMAGAGSYVSGNSNNGDSRQAMGCFLSRLTNQHPDVYFRRRNGGIGGDIVGGIGTIVSGGGAGSTAVRIKVTAGCRPYNTTIAVWFGGYALGNDGRNPTSVTSHGGNEYTINFTTPLSNTHAVGDEVGYGMHGRLKPHVLDVVTEFCIIHAGTNDSGGTLTAAEVVSGLMDLGARMRQYNIEPIFHELLPRSTNISMVAQINDELRYRCRIGGSGGSYHLVPLYRLFAKSDGTWLYPKTNTWLTATSGTGTTIVNSGAGWGTNVWANFQVRIISGTGIAQKRTITSNTSTALTVPTWGVNPDSTSVFQIEGIVNSATANTITMSGTTLGTNTYKGFSVRIVNGTGFGQTNQIKSHTNTVLTFMNNWGTTPDATSTFIIEGDTDDNLHPSDTGHQKIADADHKYMSRLQLRLGQAFLSAYDTDPTNLIQNSHMAASTATGSGFTAGFYPTGWTYGTFFAGGIVPNVEAPAIGENLVGNWATLTATNGPQAQAATSGSTTTVVMSGAAWGTNQWAGMQVRIIGGAQAGQIKTISSNTATTLTVSSAFSGAIDNTSVFSIVTTGNANFQRAVTAQTVGNQMRLCIRIKATNFVDGCAARIQFLTGSFTLDAAFDLNMDFDGVVPVVGNLTSIASSALQVQLLPNGGSGKLWVGEPIFQNLTTLGRTM